MSTATDYRSFIRSKSQLDGDHGFESVWIPSCLFDFQRSLVDWACRKGRAAIFADCGMGKTPMSLVWAENVVRVTNRPVLILTPLAVSHQFVREGEKFGIECRRSPDGKHAGSGIVVTNYERLRHFDPADFAGVVCDESSRLKNFAGKTKAAVTEFMRMIPYRLLCTATAAPNDYHELGTSSEALGYLGYQDMLSRFFKEDDLKDYLGWGRKGYRFRGHAEEPFWKWVCSWARACRKPSDLGFDDGRMILPELIEDEIVVRNDTPRDGMLFYVPPDNQDDQREERRQTIAARCEVVARMVSDTGKPAIAWCHLNEEADALERMIPDAKQVSGSMSDEEKEERLLAFQDGQLRVLVTKPKIGCFGLNFQHCSTVATFASHSYEQYYQAVRRCWRFGQVDPVRVAVVASEGETGVLANLRRKSEAADRMFARLVVHMNEALAIDNRRTFGEKEVIPRWLSPSRS